MRLECAPKPAATRQATGHERLPDGVLHVACCTDLHGCTGEMFAWWFRFRCDTQKYIWWHPVDHVYSKWEGGTPETHVGATHEVEEFFTGMPAEKLSIQFRDDAEFFDAERNAAARDLPAAGRTAEEVVQIVPDEFGQALLQHCYNEFTFLSRFLPSLFIAENRCTQRVSLLW